MKNKGMHQQPNAFTPSTGSNAPQHGSMNKGGGYNPTSSHNSAPPSWKPATTPSTSTSAPAPTANANKGFKKGKKAA